MNKVMSVLLLGAALGLTACGGDSDSSGSYTGTDTPPTPAIKQCKSEGTNVFVPNDSSCTFAIPSVNSGVAQTYTCSNGRVSLGTVSAGNSLNFGGYIIQCAS